MQIFKGKSLLKYIKKVFYKFFFKIFFFNFFLILVRGVEVCYYF